MKRNRIAIVVASVVIVALFLFVISDFIDVKPIISLFFKIGVMMA